MAQPRSTASASSCNIRDAGRLLWICDQMATPLHAADDTPALYAAVRRGVTSPGWTSNALKGASPGLRGVAA